jgi:hypothetical protein
MKKHSVQNIILFLFALLLVSQGVLQAQVSFGQPEIINEKWEFYLGDNPNEKTGWRTLDLPHDWSVEGVLNPSLAACTGYLPGGIAWYRKNITVPVAKTNEKVYIYFEGICNRSEVYLNGHLLGKRPNGYVSFLYDMTPFVEYGKENRLTVRVDHSQYADSRWYSGSGIYRNVRLIYANPIHIAQWGVFACPESVTSKEAVLHIEIEVENDTNENSRLVITNELISPAGKTVAKNSHVETLRATSPDAKISVRLKVNNPQLWDLEHPNLYLLKTTLTKNGVIVDETTTQTGFRTFTFDPNKGFALNGKWMKMKGVCLHHDAGVLGSAVPREVWERRLLTLKSLGCNAIRMTHNLQNPELYDLCDELGFLVMDEVFDEWEFPKRKWLKGWNVGEPGFQGASDYFEEWCETDLGDGVRRDRNHPSVFAWSIGNEVDYPNDPYSHPVLDGSSISQPMFGGYQPTQPSAERLSSIAKRLTAVVKKYDFSRPVTAGLAGVVMSNATEYPFVLDITGYNYTEDRYDIDHQTYPERIIYGSENRHDMPAWKAVRDKQAVFAQFLWTGIDYLGESGVWPSRGFYSGLLDFAGFIKPRGYFRKALWADEPTIYLGTYPVRKPQWGLSMDAWSVWNYEEGQSVRVVCYTNVEKAQLFLNDKPVGATKECDDNTGIIYWDIPFHAGKLEVAGFNGEREVTRYAIQTSGRPYALTATVDTSVLKKDKSLAHIIVQIVDENGYPVILSNDEITCRIEGPARLLGLEAGNNSDMGDYTDNVQRAFHGRLLAYIQTTGQTGDIKVKFSTPWLKTAEVTLESVK